MTNKYKNRLELVIIGLFICVYFVSALLVSLHRYWQFDAFWYDFGIFDETIWNLAQGALPTVIQLSPPDGKIVWADHFNPSAVFLVPFYWFTNRAEVALLAQVLFVCLSAVVAYLIARKMVDNSWVRIALIVSYLGFVGLQNALYTDVHNIVFAMLPLMLCFWSIYRKKWLWYWIFLLITLGFQESLAGLGIGIGLFLILRKRQYLKQGVLTILLSITWAYFTTQFIIPYFNQGPYAYTPSFPLAWHEWLTRFILPADLKVKTILVSLINFGLLPVFSISSWPMIAGHFIERFVLNLSGTRWDLGLHYNASLSPIMFIASIEVVRNFQKSSLINKLINWWGILTICTVVYLHRFYLHGPLMLATHPVFYQQTINNKFLQNFVDQIPEQGLLMTQNNLAAHFTHREVFLLNQNYLNIKPEVIAIDIRPGQNANNFFPLKENEVIELVSVLDQDNDYQKKTILDSQLIYHRVSTYD